MAAKLLDSGALSALCGSVATMLSIDAKLIPRMPYTPF